MSKKQHQKPQRIPARPSGEADDTKVEAAKEDEDTDTDSDDIYTYVGAGDSPPNVINFMGRQRFVRGKAVKVTDGVVLSKINGNPSFVKGEVDPETLHENDEEAALAAEEQRQKDKATNAMFHKQHKTGE